MSLPSSSGRMRGKTGRSQVSFQCIVNLRYTYLEEDLGVANDVEQTRPPRHLDLPGTPHHHVQSVVEVVQELYSGWQQGSRRVVFAVRCLGIFLDHSVQQYLKRMSEVDEVLVVRCESNSFLPLRVLEVREQNMMQEQV